MNPTPGTRNPEPGTRTPNPEPGTPNPEPGTRNQVAHYLLLDRMGEGALGEVYRARDTKFGRTVALKLVPHALFAGEGARRDFEQDARAAATLSHPNIATLFDLGEYEQGWYLAYEFAAGVTLREETAGGAVSPRRAVELAVQIGDALADAHAHGVLHGDLRPETVFVTKKGSAKILEFGMGHWTRGGQTRIRAATRPDSIAENTATTISYMSPEQAGGGTVDARTDVFSLGVILYEMLSGRNPLAAPTAAETLSRVVGGVTFPRLPESDLTADLPAVVARAVRRDVERRFQSAAALSAELRRVEALMDVRSGDAASRDLLRLDEEPGRTGMWWTIAASVAALVALLFWAFN
jgi:eukaryotic-like serine/threonine-protein kinase